MPGEIVLASAANNSVYIESCQKVLMDSFSGKNLGEIVVKRILADDPRKTRIWQECRLVILLNIRQWPKSSL